MLSYRTSLRTPQYLFKERLRYGFGAVAPKLFCLAERWKNRGTTRCVHPDTYLIVEGYPRSANSYTYRLIRGRTEESRHLAHHIHLPVQVEMGVRWKRPALVLIRAPEQAAISFVGLQMQAGCREGHQELEDWELAWRIREAVAYWIRFYEKILKIHLWAEWPAFVLAPFDIVLTNPEQVFRMLNNYFGMDIPAHPVTADEKDGILASAGYHLAPNDERNTYKARVLRLYERALPRGLHERAQTVFEQCEDIIGIQRPDWRQNRLSGRVAE